MKRWLHSLGVALGFTTLALIWIPGPLTRDTFFWADRPITLFLPIVLDFTIAWWVIALLLYSVRRPSRTRNFVWSIILFFAPILAIEAYALLPGAYVSSMVRLVVGLLCLLTWFLVQTVASRLFARHAESIIERASIVLLFLSLNGLYVLSHTIWLGWEARHLNSIPPATAKLPEAPAGRPRIVWIVMDELSHYQVYVHRPAGLSLPAFDAFAAQSSVFTNTQPAAYKTEFAMPDYMTGIPDGFNLYSANGHLEMERLDNGQKVAFNQHDTIFEDAHRSGYSTGVSGWYIPYCRLLPEVLDRCFWTDRRPRRNGMIATSSTISNMFAPMRRIAAYAIPESVSTPWFTLESNAVIDRREHIADYSNIVSFADRMLADRNVDFILLHIPIPHGPGVFDLSTGKVSAVNTSGYAGNLVLADQILAHLRSVLESSNQWDASTVIIMGDHSWRLGMEVPEDHVIGAGGFDSRPAYIVKLAGQQQGTTVSTPYDALRTRALLQALLRQQIHTPAELSAWVNRTP